MSEYLDAEALFKKKSRTFSLAATLFRPEDRQCVARLYRFCRYLDDLADTTAEGKKETLKQIVHDLKAGRQSEDPIVADFLNLADERDLPLEAAVHLAESLKRDCGPVRLGSTDDLLKYAYGVAGTVGLLMQSVIGAEHQAAAPFALDLGVAMQLTNIARDVAEDAQRSRFYVPSSWIEPEQILAALDGDKHAISLLDQQVARLITLAETYYDSARKGHGFIPKRNRIVIFLASVFYEGIGLTLKQSGTGAWRQRTSLSFFAKLRQLPRAFKLYRKYKRSYWSHPKQIEHDSSLHAAFVAAGLCFGIDQTKD